MNTRNITTDCYQEIESKPEISSFNGDNPFLPKFEIFEKDPTKQFLEILVDIKFGKGYLPNLEQRIDQKNQKGITCFYYALNTLRPRFGKFFSESHPGRDIEKKISNYRKAVTDLGNLHEYLLNLASLITHDKNELKQYQEKYSEEIIEKLGKPFFEVIQLFIDYDKFSLEGVVNIYIAFKMMANAENLLHSF